MNGPEGDMTAARIELFLTPSGDELRARRGVREPHAARAESRNERREVIYTTSDEIYVITGTPVKIVDQCQRENRRQDVDLQQGTDNIVVDGNSQIRTQTKGGNGKCS